MDYCITPLTYYEPEDDGFTEEEIQEKEERAWQRKVDQFEEYM